MPHPSLKRTLRWPLWKHDGFGFHGHGEQLLPQGRAPAECHVAGGIRWVGGRDMYICMYICIYLESIQ